MILDGSRVVAQAIEGNGGNIAITADVLLVPPDSLISASSQLGIQGAVPVFYDGVDAAPAQQLAGVVLGKTADGEPMALLVGCSG